MWVFATVGFLESMPFLMAEGVILIDIDNLEDLHIPLWKMRFEFFTCHLAVLAGIHIAEMGVVGRRIRHGRLMILTAGVAGARRSVSVPPGRWMGKGLTR